LLAVSGNLHTICQVYDSSVPLINWHSLCKKFLIEPFGPFH